MARADACLDEACELPEPQGWAMRKGHRKRLARGSGREAHRGRASFARSVNRRRPAQAERVNMCKWQQRPVFSVGEEAALCRPAAQHEREECMLSKKEPARWQAALEWAEECRAAYALAARREQRWAALVVGLAKVRPAEMVRRAKARQLAAAFVREFPRDPSRPLRRLYSAEGRVHRHVGITPCEPAREEHERLMALVQPRDEGAMPQCWEGRGRRVKELGKGEEFEAVAGFFLATLGMEKAEVLAVSRLQHPRVYESCLDKEGFGKVTLMFHGCRTKANEESIIEQGFKVSRCHSGGANFGTWFAYRARYSNGGYVFQDSSGARHIFVCMVSDRYAVKADDVMRVVGQGCAYPLWLLRYRT